MNNELIMLQTPTIRSFVSALTPAVQAVRFRYSFATKRTGTSLWNSVAPAKRRTGRGKRGQNRKKIDLGKGKRLGEGKANMLWPGLNTSMKTKVIARRTEEQIALEEERAEKKRQRFARVVTEPIRPWSGGRWGGIRIDPPMPHENQSFNDFECVVMEAARVGHRDNVVGRIYRQRLMVAVGNGNGVIGVGNGTSSDMPAAARKARNKAFSRLQFVKLFENRTVFEDIYVNHHRTWMWIRKQPPGQGLRCHRAVTDLCKLIGFKDLYVKTFGSMCMLNLLKCFLKGVTNQESYQEKADRTGYHVVEFDPRRSNYPVVLAAPSAGHEEAKMPVDEYKEYINQDLLMWDVKKHDERRWSHFYRALATDNRGIPVPRPQSMPEELRRIRQLSL